MLFECIHSLVIPAGEQFLRRTLHKRDVNGDVLRLADPVQPANALFQQLRIERQIKQNQMMRELEIASFAADFGADQDLRATILRKPGGVPVALNERKFFMKNRALYID